MTVLEGATEMGIGMATETVTRTVIETATGTATAMATKVHSGIHSLNLNLNLSLSLSRRIPGIEGSRRTHGIGKAWGSRRILGTSLGMSVSMAETAMDGCVLS
jgi:hypothetical protein